MSEMKTKYIKKFFAVSIASIALVGCGQLADDGTTETDSDGGVSQEITVSNVEVNVTSGITEAVEKVNDGVVSIINLRRTDYQ